MQNTTSATHRTWTKPEVISIASAGKAQAGENSHAVDILYPASNGAQVPIS
jgi:hypothetical protein